MRKRSRLNKLTMVVEDMVACYHFEGRDAAVAVLDAATYSAIERGDEEFALALRYHFDINIGPEVYR